MDVNSHDVYLDYAATTPVDPAVLDAMLPMLGEAFGNPSSVHRRGRAARVAVETAREKVARSVGVEPAEIVFTSGATEANNLALRGAVEALRSEGRSNIRLVTVSTEHDAVLEPVRDLLGNDVSVTILGPSEATPERVADEVNQGDGGIASVMHTNNETGTRLNLADTAARVTAGGSLLHSDCVQAPVYAPLNLHDIGLDLASFSAHKVYGPKGIGALFVRSGTPFKPTFLGGKQERSRRGGTENVAAIVGFGVAMELAARRAEEDAAHFQALRTRLLGRLKETMGGSLMVNSPSDGAPHILNVSVGPGSSGSVDGEMLLLGLDMAGVAVSSGSACASGAVTPSHVLLAMGVPPQTAVATVRFSLGRATTTADVDYAADQFARVARRAGAAL